MGMSVLIGLTIPSHPNASHLLGGGGGSEEGIRKARANRLRVM